MLDNIKKNNFLLEFRGGRLNPKRGQFWVGANDMIAGWVILKSTAE